MAKVEKIAPQWLNRYSMVDPAHQDDLEAAAAVHELHHGLPREDAEAKAHGDYSKARAIENAAHHLIGIRAAHASGHDEAAKQHGQAYAGAMRHAGLDPFGPPPDEVMNHLRDDQTRPQVYSFRGHDADHMFSPSESSADDDDAKLKEALARMMSLKDQLK